MSREGKGDTDWTQPVGVGGAVRHAGGEEYSVKHCGSAKCCQTQQQSGVLSDSGVLCWTHRLVRRRTVRHSGSTGSEECCA